MQLSELPAVCMYDVQQIVCHVWMTVLLHMLTCVLWGAFYVFVGERPEDPQDVLQEVQEALYP